MAIKLTTKVIATTRDKDGNITNVQEGKNTITEGNPASSNNGLAFMLERIFAYDIYFASTTDYINKAQLGTGTPTAGGLGTPITATKKAINTKAFDETGGTWYDNPTFVATITWDASYGALSNITEVGLMTQDNEYLVAYKTYTPALSKEADGDLTLQWEMQLSYT